MLFSHPRVPQVVVSLKCAELLGFHLHRHSPVGGLLSRWKQNLEHSVLYSLLLKSWKKMQLRLMWNVIIIYHRVEFRIEYKNLTSLQRLEKGRVSTRKKIMKTQNVYFVIFLQ